MRLNDRMVLVELLYRLQRELMEEAEVNDGEYSDGGELDEAVRTLLCYLD